MKRLLFFSLGWFFVAAAAFAEPAPRDSTLSITEVASGLSTPTTMAFIGPQDSLLLQKNDGQVRRVTAGVLQPNPVLDVAVDNSSERGLLGIALHPDFPVSPFVYLYYTESATAGDSTGSAAANRVYRYTWNGTALTSPLLILELPVDPGPNHNGGAIAFGPDEKLYVVIGDLNRNGRLQNFSSGPPDDTSVILRINPDGSIPDDNPFFAQGGNLAKYFAYGIRNSFGLAFDPLTDELWMTENGPDAFDEINLVQPGFNSGWETLMGPDSRNANNASSLFMVPGAHYADPKFSWLKTIGPTAIVFLDSTNLGEQYENDVFVGDVNNGNLYRFEPNDTRDGFVLNGSGLSDFVADNDNEVDQNIFATGFAGITDLKVGPDGLLYVVSIGDGKIYAISRDTTEPLAVGVTSLGNGEVGVPYSADLAISGGVEPYTIELTRGALPAGLQVVNGIIVVTPVQRKGLGFTLRVTDQRGVSLTKRFHLAVVGAVTIGNRNLPAGRAGRRYRARLRPDAGKKPYAWSLIAGALPAGLAFDPGTVSIAGIPLAARQTNLTFQVTDSLGGTSQRTLTLDIR